MADFRFKISGDSSPFLAELYDGSNLKIATQVAEYSGLTTSGRDNYTRVIFNGLNPETNYYVKVTDNIGNITQSTTKSTPPNPSGLESPATDVSLSLLGTGYYSEGDGFITIDTCLIQEPKYIDITPEPQGNECITVTLSAISCSSEYSVGSVGYVRIYKRDTPYGSYNIQHIIEQQTIGDIQVSIGEGERVCYDLYTGIGPTYTENDKYACAELQIVGSTNSGYDNPVNVSTINSCLDVSQTCPVTTTTTTTTLEDIIVYFNNITADDSEFYSSCKNAVLSTYPEINSGQSFRVCFELVNWIEIIGSISDEIYQCGCVDAPNKTIEHITSCSSSDKNFYREDGYIDVDANNINNVSLLSKITSTVSNYGDDFNHSQCVCICSITSMNGANFLYDINGYPSVISVNSASGSFGGGIEFTTTDKFL